MRTKGFFPWTVAVLVSLGGCVGYWDLQRELETYKPSGLYEAQLQPAAPVELPASRVEDDFREQVAKIREMKARWEEALEEPQPATEFYKPDPDLLRRLGAAATDPAPAQRVLAGRFSLQELETLVLVRNPAVRSAERGFRGTLESYSQVWNLDEILRQYTAFTEALMTGVGPIKGREPTELKFPFPGVLALKGEVVSQEVKASRETLEIARRSAVTMARRTFWNLLYVRRAQEITGQMLALLEHLERVAKARYEAGATSFQDVIKIRIERDILREELRTLKEQQRNLEVKLLEILDLPPEVAVGAAAKGEPSTEVPEIDRLYALASERRQELRRLRAQVGKMERMIEMAETAIYPSYTLNLSLFQDEAVTQVGTTREKEPFAVSTTASAGAGLPKMPWFGTNDAYLRETRQRLEALRQDLKRAEEATMNRVREAWFSLDRARREEALYAGRVVNLSQAALDVSTRAYEAGKVSFADVISSYTSWLKAHLALERKRSDLGVARAELQEAVGAQW